MAGGLQQSRFCSTATKEGTEENKEEFHSIIKDTERGKGACACIIEFHHLK